MSGQLNNSPGIARFHPEPLFPSKRFTWHSIWYLIQMSLIVSACISTAVVLLYEVFGFKFVAIPFLPVATIGTAVAFYISILFSRG